MSINPYDLHPSSGSTAGVTRKISKMAIYHILAEQAAATANSESVSRESLDAIRDSLQIIFNKVKELKDE